MHILAIIAGLLVAGCATAQSGRLITPEQAAWIEKGVTTRADVVAKLGAPRFEHPIYSPANFSTKTTTSTTTQRTGPRA
jgi:outer membrane protein assembly factor BamE (lipoprotein component of BamABCDE complex)